MNLIRENTWQKNTFWFELEEDFSFFFLLSFKEQVNVNYIVGAYCCSAG